MKTEIEQIKEELAKLRQKIAELKNQPQELTRESGMPMLNENNYYIDYDGEFSSNVLGIENDFEYFNSFNTITEAETERDYTLASRRVRAWAKAVNGDWKADWEDDDEKWGVSFDANRFDIDSSGRYNWFIHQIAFPSQELATKFLELFRPELEILSNP